MSIELGLIAVFAIVGLGGAALAGTLIWLHKRSSDQRQEQHPHHA